MIVADWNVEINRPPEDVFDFVADLHNEPQFNPDALKAALERRPRPSDRSTR
jgi:hypothetical protein